MELSDCTVESEGASVQQLEQHGQGDFQNSEAQLHNRGLPTVSNSTVPSSPPIDPQLGFDVHHQSPSTPSSHSTPTPQYFGGLINNLESQQQRHQPLPPTSQPGHIMPVQSNQPSYQNSPYPPSPSAASSYSYQPPNNQNTFTGSPAMYSQRPLPNNFPPPMHNVVNTPLSNPPEATSIDTSNPNQLQHQHHHYLAQTSATNFSGPSQDRYVCQVCNKAFSRPSSLRIHSYSHTGEKPFVCSHKGCGKAFSVRSNMKRHQRGCHGGGSPEST